MQSKLHSCRSARNREIHKFNSILIRLTHLAIAHTQNTTDMPTNTGTRNAWPYMLPALGHRTSRLLAERRLALDPNQDRAPTAEPKIACLSSVPPSQLLISNIQIDFARRIIMLHIESDFVILVLDIEPHFVVPPGMLLLRGWCPVLRARLPRTIRMPRTIVQLTERRVGKHVHPLCQALRIFAGHNDFAIGPLARRMLRGPCHVGIGRPAILGHGKRLEARVEVNVLPLLQAGGHVRHTGRTRQCGMHERRFIEAWSGV